MQSMARAAGSSRTRIRRSSEDFTIDICLIFMELISIWRGTFLITLSGGRVCSRLSPFLPFFVEDNVCLRDFYVGLIFVVNSISLFFDFFRQYVTGG